MVDIPLEFRILGPLEVARAGERVRLGGRKQRAVLARLLLDANRVVSLDRLANDVYGEVVPATAVAQVQTQISQLRKLLEPERQPRSAGSLLETRPPGYMIHLEPEQLDSFRAERLAEEGKKALEEGDAAPAAACLREALDLWRGPVLADFAYESFTQPAIGRLEELRLATVEQRIDADLALGRHAALVGELDALVAEHPLRERLRAQLMLALYRSDRQAEALDVYHTTRRTLGEELGIEPSPSLRELATRMLRHDPSLEQPAPARRSRAESTAVEQPGANPYKGLRAFVEADAPDFFGREGLTERLIERLAKSRFLAVVGPSGSGKSSVVRAGLVPALRTGALPGSEGWQFVAVAPGAYPLEELEAALLRVAVNPPASLLEQLEGDERGLLRAVKRVLPDDCSELVLVVDQLEELFTLLDAEGRRMHYLALLEHAVTDPHSRLRVVVTLRADFYDRPLAYRDFALLLHDRVETVLPLSPEEIERAVAGPAKRVGVTLEDGLVAEIVADVVDEPGALPLLQYALTELYDRRDAAVLTRSAYEAIGGVSGALARRAEGLYAGLAEGGKQAAKQLFLQLVALGEAADTRRRVDRAELASLDVDQEALARCVDEFGASRLLSFDRDPRTAAPTVEVAHEALLDKWDRLAAWIEVAREDVLMQRRLSATGREWQAAGRDASFLLRGSQLSRFEAWAQTSSLARTELERDFIRASLEEQAAGETAEETRRAREAALERRSGNRLRALVAVLAIAALIAAALTVFAFAESDRSKREATIATDRELSAASVANLDVDPELSILLGIQAVDRSRGIGGPVLSEAEAALHRAVQATREVRTIENPATAAVAWSPDGSRIATAGASGLSTRKVNEVVVWDARTARKVLVLSGHTTTVHDAAYSPDGSLLATSDDTGTTIVWDARTGKRMFTLPNHDRSRGFAGVRFSPDGTLLAAEDWAGNIRLWQVASRKVVRTIHKPAGLCDLSFSPDGARIAAGNCFGNEAYVWDVATGRLLLTLRGHTDVVFSAKFSPDGRRIATASGDGTARIWDAHTGKSLVTMSGHNNWVQALVWSPDGRTIATGGIDGTARVWDARSGRELLVLRGHTGVVDDIEFSPDGQRLVTGSDDGTARVWDVSPSGSRDWATLAADAGGVTSIAYSRDGRRLLTTGKLDSTVRLWSPSTWTLDRAYHIGGERDDVAFLPDGAAFVSSGATVQLTDVASSRTLWTLPARGWIPSIAVSPDGKLVAVGLATTNLGSGFVTLWDARTGKLLRRLGRPEGLGGVAHRLAFAPDGKLLAAARWDGTTQLWDVATGRLRATLPNDRIRVQSVAFSPDGRLLATAGWDGNAKLWDIGSGRLLRTLAGHIGTIQDVAFSPDGKLLATAGDDTTARLWDVASGREVLTLNGHSFGLTGVRFSPDGTRLVTSSGDGTVRVYALPIDQLLAVAQSRLTRTWTKDECRSYLPGGSCPPGVDRG